MWTCRILNGQLAGQIIELKELTTIGRDPSCNIVVSDNGISKKHVQIEIVAGVVTLIDLNSSNGTYVNGLKIKQQKLKIGDKFSLYQTIFELGIQQKQLIPKNNSLARQAAHLSPKDTRSDWSQKNGTQPSPNLINTNSASPIENNISSNFSSHSLIEKLDHKVMNGVYSLIQNISFKYFFITVMILFVLTVTILSVIPLYTATNESVAFESQQRALSVARGIAKLNENQIRMGEIEKYSAEALYKERGVESVYVINKEGIVIAPGEISGSQPKHSNFVKKIRGQPREYVERSIDNVVLAAVPIVVFDSEAQQNVAKAHVVLVYQPQVLNFDDERMASLFIQVLVIAFLIGFFLFYVLFRIIEYVFNSLRLHIDDAVRLGVDQIRINFDFPAMQDLITIINSLINKANQNHSSTQTTMDRSNEVINLAAMMPYPSLVIMQDRQIININPAFVQMMGISVESLVGRTIFEIPDRSMQENLDHLMNTAALNTNSIQQDHLEISGNLFNLQCQALSIRSDEVDSYLITISPATEGSE